MAVLTQKKKVAVVGAGISGILAITALEEEGHEPVCFEKMETFGGVWKYREKAIDGVGSTMATTVINHSKEMGAFSNFPPNKEYHNFMRHDQFYQYLTEYAKHNQCERHIRFNTEVTYVKRHSDYNNTGRWEVTVRNNVTGETSSDIYDGVLICVGHVDRPKLANYPGQDAFKGKIMHTHSLKEVTEFRGQNVVVIGTGCSGLDAAVEISSVAKQVYLSTRSGAMVFNRLGPHGYPLDYVLLRRYLMWTIEALPINLCSWYVESIYLDPKFDHRLYAVQPQHHFLSKDPIISDHIGPKLATGIIIQKPDVVRFTENGVMFNDESKITDADTVIMATGYTFKFPFLEEGVLDMEDGVINLYKCMFPTQLKHPTLAFVGFVLPYGALFPMVELQTRWAAQLFSGNLKLPSEKQRLEDVKKRYEQNKGRFSPSERMTVRVDYIQYQDEIASQIGAKPRLLKLLFKDIKLFLQLLFGPSLPYQYRLEGPHTWDGARRAIMESDYRVQWPLCKGAQLERGIFQKILEYILNLIPTNIYFKC